jgi:hypothetical protein
VEIKRVLTMGERVGFRKEWTADVGEEGRGEARGWGGGDDWKESSCRRWGRGRAAAAGAWRRRATRRSSSEALIGSAVRVWEKPR